MASLASVTSGFTAVLGHLNGWVALGLIAALVFGETAVFLGFVLPGEAAVVLGGVLASRGHVSLPLLIGVVVIAAVAGPFVGYEIGKRMGDRLFTSPRLRRIAGPLERAKTTLRNRGGVAVLGGRFVAVVRALMPAAAGAAGVRYRTFAIHNTISGIVWGVGYSLLGYVAGSAYVAVERAVGAGLAVALAVLILSAAGVWAWRRHRRLATPSGSVTDAVPVDKAFKETASTKTEPVKTEPVKTEPAKAEPAKAERAKTEPAKPELTKTSSAAETSAAGALTAETVAGRADPGHPRADPGRSEPVT